MWRYFHRNSHTESAARTLAAPLAAGILLSGAAPASAPLATTDVDA